MTAMKHATAIDGDTHPTPTLTSAFTSAFTSVRVFSATLREAREALGERITEWISSRGDTIEIVDMVQRQSSDSAFHLVTIVIFFNETGKHRIDHAIKVPTTSSAATRRLSFRDGG